jgi:ubiquinone/menaquinone biosynthesis C-methylase UbiE
MKHSNKLIADLIIGMRDCYAKGDNVMQWYKSRTRTSLDSAQSMKNSIFSTLVAYDLQSGSYTASVAADKSKNSKWCKQAADVISIVATDNDSILEVGVGEATTLAGMLKQCAFKPGNVFGFDVSWSRVALGNQWLAENKQEAALFVADLLNMPLEDNSIDIVYSSHSLEPNGGKEELAIKECLRVAKKFVVLIEPIYELASVEAQDRMRKHGYIQGLHATATKLGVEILKYGLLPITDGPHNPSGVLILRKRSPRTKTSANKSRSPWQCPLSSEKLKIYKDAYYAETVGLAYPTLSGVPMLRPEHVIVASKLGDYIDLKHVNYMYGITYKQRCA